MTSVEFRCSDPLLILFKDSERRVQLKILKTRFSRIIFAEPPPILFKDSERRVMCRIPKTDVFRYVQIRAASYLIQR